MKRFLTLLALALAAAGAHAQEVTLRVHHFLPPQSTIHAQVLVPWCEALAREAAGRLRCQIHPSMQLGGTPQQLFDQARDGVVDVVWTLPTYQAGRFPKSEVFELPFMARNATGGSAAFWEYVQKHALDEFRGVKLLALHLHDGSSLHFAQKRVTRLEDLKGLKVRAPTRIGTRFLAALGAVPVQMPVPQVTESISKGVIDGAMVPWEVVPAMKLQEVTRYHLDNPPDSPKMSNSIFVMAMNAARYESLPPDLRAMIDARSGIALSRAIGAAYDAATDPARRLAADQKGVFDVLSADEYDRWQKASESVVGAWISEVAAKGGNGAALYDDAKALLKKHGG